MIVSTGRGGASDQQRLEHQESSPFRCPELTVRVENLKPISGRWTTVYSPPDRTTGDNTGAAEIEIYSAR